MRKSKQFKKVVEMSKWYIDRVRKDNERIRTCKERMTDTYYCANYYTPIKPTLTQQYTHVIDNCKYSALDKHIGFDEMDEESFKCACIEWGDIAYCVINTLKGKVI